MYRNGMVMLILVLTLRSVAYGQAGVSSSSVGISKAGLHRTTVNGQFRLPPADYFRVEEFVNYHRHQLPLPNGSQSVLLDIRQTQLNRKKSIVQVGITTPRAMDPKKMPLLNVVLVIDQSGSMSGDRLRRVKESIRAFVERFRPQDRISIVGFNHSARVHLNACEKSSLGRIQKAIDSIEAGGSTNLHAGLMLGYQIAQKNLDTERTNRVILLTDGLANVGTTNSQQIAEQSGECNKQGISLSTIGLGDNFNHELLRKLADQGKGLLHFVKDSSDIHKTFVSEVDSLLAPAAQGVRLRVQFSRKCAVKVFGYDPRKENETLIFDLDNLNHGATQVILFEVVGKKPKVTAKIDYVDSVTRNSKSLMVKNSAGELDAASRYRVKRNYGIALLAQSLRDAACQSNQGEATKAERLLKKGLEASRSVVNSERSLAKDDIVQAEDDEHWLRVAQICEKYRAELSKCSDLLD